MTLQGFGYGSTKKERQGGEHRTVRKEPAARRGRAATTHRPEYVPVLRATAGIIAGEMSFSYDEVLNLRVAVSEAFMMAVSCVASGEDAIGELTVRFTIGARGLEVLIPALRAYTYDLHGEEEMERRGLLRTLVDELELGPGGAGEPIVRILKHKPDGGV